MYLDLKKKNHSLISNLKKLNNFYDYIIIGTGPAASVLINNLVKTNKKILVVERGGLKKNFGKNLKSESFKIKKNSRIFGIGGTSNEWSQIYSLLSEHEMQNFNKNNIWPLSHKDLTYWCKKIHLKYKFNIKQVGSERILNNKFYIRKFIEIRSPIRFSKYYQNREFDLLTNCTVNSLEENKRFNKIFFKINKINCSINSKKIIVCAGGIESSLLILNSLKKKRLKNLKNKKFIGRYFMDHPKCYVGELEYPNMELINNYKLKYKKNINVYSGISLFKKNQRLLNTYIRFEEKKTFFNLKKKIKLRIFLEMEPKFKNRISVYKNIGKVNLSLSKKEIETSKTLLKEIIIFFSLNPKKEKLNFNKKNLVGASHHMGGMVFPKVVDKNLKIQGIKNIFCCSSAIFPTSGSVNPTLIICALAERLSVFLKQK